MECPICKNEMSNPKDPEPNFYWCSYCSSIFHKGYLAMLDDMTFDEYDKMPQETIELLELKKKIKAARAKCRKKYSYNIKDLCGVCEWTVVCKEVEE